MHVVVHFPLLPPDEHSHPARQTHKKRGKGKRERRPEDANPEILLPASPFLPSFPSSFIASAEPRILPPFFLWALWLFSLLPFLHFPLVHTHTRGGGRGGGDRTERKTEEGAKMGRKRRRSRKEVETNEGRILPNFALCKK